MTLAELHRLASLRLKSAGIAYPALDARLIVEHFTNTTRADLIARPDRTVDTSAIAAVEQALARRAAGEPVHRIFGFREFYGLTLRLSKETLEPRPDTEILVDALLPFVRDSAARTGGCKILDLGTGTGAIALALLSSEPRATAIGVDLSEDALSTAAANAETLGLAARFAALKSNWFDDVPGKFHAIAANPPYIQSEAIAGLARDVRDFDPILALDGGADGLEAYRTIALGAADHLESHGRVGVEIGHDQARSVTTLFDHAGFALLDRIKDYGGNDRVLIFARNAGAA